MKVVIEIPEEEYKMFQTSVNMGIGNSAMVRILAGKPLDERTERWNRLYNWLNDMRYGIAPDERVTDIDERNVRIAQTDILDDIMEWMAKQDVESEG